MCVFMCTCVFFFLITVGMDAKIFSVAGMITREEKQLFQNLPSPSKSFVVCYLQTGAQIVLHIKYTETSAASIFARHLSKTVSSL